MSRGKASSARNPGGSAPLNRALSKLGILSRTRATEAILDGRVRVDGRVVRDPSHAVVPERARIEVDGELQRRTRSRTIAFYKPRGVVTTRHDPDGRRTVFDVLGEAAEHLVAVGRLDLATSGLLLLTTDTQLANWITDPANRIPRVYVVTVRGEVTREHAEARRAANVTVRKASARESHLIVELHQGRNREIRRMFDAIGHEVTRLKRVSIGGVELGDLRPGEWRELSPREIARLQVKS